MTVPELTCELGSARVNVVDGRLMAETGCVTREWVLTDAGLVSRAVAVAGLPVIAGTGDACDWQLPTGGEATGATLLALAAAVSDDDGFTREHIQVTASWAFAASGLRVDWRLWVYPDADGMRTQLGARLLTAAERPAPVLRGRMQDAARVDLLPLPDEPVNRRYFGYYLDTQNRNDTHLDILKEALNRHSLVSPELCSWASVACLETDEGGVALVKESHKAVNQTGVHTGDFRVQPDRGLACTGWGLSVADLNAETTTWGWATWTIGWAGGDHERESAFKRFDATRYPIDPARDIYVQANTWGSTDYSEDARRAACQDSVMRELEVCAELGIDMLQIDDGWQVTPGHSSWREHDPSTWTPHPQAYPQGWAPVRARAAELGVGLGLWAAAVPVTLAELKQSYDDGGFRQYKLDFAQLENRGMIDELMAKVRAFIAYTDHSVRVNWDATEICKRYGYFFAREYGCVYLENRKPRSPHPVCYRPHTVLRDLWQLAKYVNLHRFQGSIQNVAMTDPELSDASRHSQAYATAIPLMSIPLFFLETKYLSDAAKAEIKPILDAYRQHREAIYRGVVYPIGAKPDNGSWTGFQCHLADEWRGYLTVFRELANPSPTAELRLRGIDQGQLRLTNLLTGESWRQPVSEGGGVSLRIDAAADFRFLAYEQTAG